MPIEPEQIKPYGPVKSDEIKQLVYKDFPKPGQTKPEPEQSVEPADFSDYGTVGGLVFGSLMLAYMARRHVTGSQPHKRKERRRR